MEIAICSHWYIYFLKNNEKKEEGSRWEGKEQKGRGVEDEEEFRQETFSRIYYLQMRTRSHYMKFCCHKEFL